MQYVYPPDKSVTITPFVGWHRKIIKNFVMYKLVSVNGPGPYIQHRRPEGEFGALVWMGVRVIL